MALATPDWRLCRTVIFNQPNRKKQQVKNSLAKEEKSDPKQKSFENREFNLDKSPAAMMAKMKAKADEMKAMQAMCGF